MYLPYISFFDKRPSKGVIQFDFNITCVPVIFYNIKLCLLTGQGLNPKDVTDILQGTHNSLLFGYSVN